MVYWGRVNIMLLLFVGGHHHYHEEERDGKSMGLILLRQCSKKIKIRANLGASLSRLKSQFCLWLACCLESYLISLSLCFPSSKIVMLILFASLVCCEFQLKLLMFNMENDACHGKHPVNPPTCGRDCPQCPCWKALLENLLGCESILDLLGYFIWKFVIFLLIVK